MKSNIIVKHYVEQKTSYNRISNIYIISNITVEHNVYRKIKQDTIFSPSLCPDDPAVPHVQYTRAERMKVCILWFIPQNLR